MRTNRAWRLVLGVAALAIVAIVAVMVGCGSDDADVPMPTSTTTSGGTDGSDPASDPATSDEPAPERAVVPLGRPQPVPSLTDPTHQQLAQGCYAGALVDCDELYFGNGGVEEASTYGATCGGRLPDGIYGQCVVDHGDTAERGD